MTRQIPDPLTNAKQTAQRPDLWKKEMERLMAVRHPPPNGPDKIEVTLDTLRRMMKDKEFQPFAAYATKLLCYANGTPRKTPVRPLFAHEMGMWRGKIVILVENADGMRVRPSVSVPSKVE